MRFAFPFHSIVFVVLALVAAAPKSGAQPAYDVRACGAIGDGHAKDTAAFDTAIAAASKAGGGEVVVPAGRYLCGTIHLRSSILLRLLPGAVIAVSPDEGDFDPYERLTYDSHADRETTYTHYALIMGDGLKDVAIIGPGIVDGNRVKRGGPKPIALKSCERVTIRDVAILNAPNYCVSLLGCSDVTIDSVRIRNAYADGIDPDCCRFVRISNCFVESSDDALCLKSSLALGRPLPTEHVTITNCVLSSGANCFKMGTESSGAFKNIAISNCAMYGRPEDPGDSGVAIESVDGAIIDGVTVSNLTMQGVGNPFFMRLGSRGRGQTPPVPGRLVNVSLANIVATDAITPISITGIPGHPVCHIRLSNVQIEMFGAVAQPGPVIVPENEAKYPECRMFGGLPAFGLYCRHADDVTIRDFAVRCAQPDARTAVTFEDVRRLAIHDSMLAAPSSAEPVVILAAVLDAQITNCRIDGSAQKFVRVSGAASARIRLISNDLSSCRSAMELTGGARRAAVSLSRDSR